mmetsp:Transcript_7828/g.14176  ORF Transcript_7828/g.14176 Transcript_7828/m.14176 type:complete len:515 (+) Transcript_7828:18-1562(+)|eukprot:CAMPEP_0182490784 /NCGR_PEP_ID=MMETSP1321-20130603/511_1 /TAXON_ID=91990 /ORGANISM="Bolidomonas sp., Strain RCC1657" /LENGTH=514 /DNA_ID=CAMNT_0024693015 /DNA_START=20 /DNA_END=1567 /DNA_ORIENTATION=-
MPTDAESSKKKAVVFNASKKETHHPTHGYKRFFRRLRSAYNVKVNKDDVTFEKMSEASAVIFGCPNSPFTTTEFEAIKRYVNSGGSVMFLLSEGGEERCQTNVNFLLEQFGMSVCPDSVVRTVYHKYLHPKQVYIANGILHPEIAEKKSLGGKHKKSKHGKENHHKHGHSHKLSQEEIDSHAGLTFVYPYGSSLNVTRPSNPILSSGPISFPLNRPIGGVYEVEKAQQTADAKHAGRIVLLGSAEIFGDEYIDKEENGKMADVLVKYMLHEDHVKLERTRDPELDEKKRVPDIEALAERLKPCLQEGEPLPQDFTQLFNDTLFKFDTSKIPEAVKLYDTLNVKHEPLSLIPPQFECPLPPLQPAVFLPHIREAPPPALDQFDLDEHFANDNLRLAQLTNKCAGDDDLEYYVKEAGEIMGVTGQLPDHEKDAKHVLNHIFTKLVQFKMLNQDAMGGGDDTGMGNPQANYGAAAGLGYGGGYGGGYGAGEPSMESESKGEMYEGGGGEGKDVMTFG